MVIIERATGDDFEHICALGEIAASEPERRRIARALAESRCSVARADGRVRGCVVLGHGFFAQGFVEMLIVHREFRRRGIATALLRAAELDCQTAKLFIAMSQSDVAMQRLCERAGFVRSGSIENLSETPTLVYVRFLTGQSAQDPDSDPD